MKQKKMTRKQQLLHILNALHNRQCSYITVQNPGTPEVKTVRAERCDCKFTDGQSLAFSEAGNGCPEIYVIKRVIENMSEDLCETVFDPMTDPRKLKLVSLAL